MLPLIDPSCSPRGIEEANAIRDKFLETITGYLNANHLPALNQQEKDNVINKVMYLLENETRLQFWLGLRNHLDLRIKDGFFMLKPIILIWAGKKKHSTPKELKPRKIGHAKNGRVVRSTRGL